MSEIIERGGIAESSSETTVTVRRTQSYSSRVNPPKSGKILIVREYDNNKVTEYIPKSAKNGSAAIQAPSKPKSSELEKVAEEIKEKVKEEIRKEVKEETVEKVQVKATQRLKQEVRREVKEETVEMVQVKATERQKQEVRQEVKEETVEMVQAKATQKVREEIREEVKQEVKEEIKTESAVVLNEEAKKEVTQTSVKRASSFTSGSRWSKSSIMTRFTVNSRSSLMKKTFVSPGLQPKKLSTGDITLPISQNDGFQEDAASETASNASEPVIGTSGRRKFKVSKNDANEVGSGVGTRWQIRRSEKTKQGKQKFAIPSGTPESAGLSFPSFLDQYGLGADAEGKDTVSGGQQVQINNQQYSIVMKNGRPMLITYLKSERSSKKDGEPEVMPLGDSRPWFCAKYLSMGN